MVEPLDALGGDHDDVLDARAPLAVEVDARLHRERHARLERPGVAADDVGLLVHVDADAVPGAVDEPLPQPGLGDRPPRGRVDLLGGHPGPHARHRPLLGVLEHRVGLADLGRRLPADRVGAGGVGVVAARQRTADVDHDDVADLDHPVRHVVVRARAVGTRADDHERRLRVPLLDDRGRDVGRGLRLGAARLEELGHPGVHAVDRGARGPQLAHLGRVLAHPQLAQHPARPGSPSRRAAPPARRRRASRASCPPPRSGSGPPARSLTSR